MSLKLHELPPQLRARIEAQIAEEDRALDKLETCCAKLPEVQALVSRVQKPAGGTQGMGFRITCIAFRKRLLDAHDAVAYSFKPLTDAIAESIGLDDADPRLSWQYGQQQTKGSEGVIVIIEEL